MHGVNLMLVCMIPSFFQKYGNVSTVSGVLNSCTYVGSAVSTYGIALLSEAYSWKFTLFIWVLIALLGTIICFIASKKEL
jgi:OPA family glycerol-3-phosphate transporter-like MFS transporter